MGSYLFVKHDTPHAMSRAFASIPIKEVVQIREKYNRTERFYFQGYTLTGWEPSGAPPLEWEAELLGRDYGYGTPEPVAEPTGEDEVSGAVAPQGDDFDDAAADGRDDATADDDLFLGGGEDVDFFGRRLYPHRNLPGQDGPRRRLDDAVKQAADDVVKGIDLNLMDSVDVADLVFNTTMEWTEQDGGSTRVFFSRAYKRVISNKLGMLKRLHRRDELGDDELVMASVVSCLNRLLNARVLRKAQSPGARPGPEWWEARAGQGRLTRQDAFASNSQRGLWSPSLLRTALGMMEWLLDCARALGESIQNAMDRENMPESRGRRRTRAAAR